MIFHIGQVEIDTVKVRAWVNSSRGRTLAFWLTVAAVVLLPLTAYFAFFRAGRKVDDGTRVVLYTTADEPVVNKVVDAFKQANPGIDVRIVTDTEATRGALKQRVLDEKTKPRADVWWSSEVVGTVQLAKAGTLAPWASRSEASVSGGWPKHLRPDMSWYGFAQRARVIAFNTNQVSKARAPTKLREFLRTDLKGKIGMANPRFGTTRSHMAYLVWMAGDSEFRAWLKGAKENGLQVFPSNSAVVQALGRGDIAVGLTDTDDVWAGQHEKWTIDLNYEPADTPRDTRPGTLKPDSGQIPSKGTLVLPNSVARILGSPNATAGGKLADFLLSPEVERILAESESRNVPIRADLAKQFKDLAVPTPAEADYAAIAAAEERAMKIVDEILGQ